MFSITTSLLLFVFAAQASAHLSFVAVYGSNQVTGRGFGVHTDGKYPRRVGQPGDAGGDSTVFQTGTDNPSPSCGSTPELGKLDIPAWLSQAEGEGLPSAYANRSVVVEAFQVNRDGGGPMTCQYNHDATAGSWKDLPVNLNQAGNSGIHDALRENSTLVMTFPEDATCTGGWTGTACIVRCRTGVNKRFGGCFAVKLHDSAVASVVTGSKVAVQGSLSSSQVNVLVAQIISSMKSQGLVVQASSSAALTSRSSAQPAAKPASQVQAVHYSPVAKPVSKPAVSTPKKVTKPKKASKAKKTKKSKKSKKPHY